MKILVSAASRHGSTGDIGRAIGSALREEGFSVAILPPEQVDSIAGYEALVFGSAVYAGHWQASAKELIHRNAGEYADRPVWLFCSGPIGDPPRPVEEPADVKDLMRVTSARGHRIFAESLTKKRLSFPEKVVVKAFRAPEGDYREWPEVQSWAREIADALRSGQ